MTTKDLPLGWAEAPLEDLFVHKSGNSKIIKGKQASSPAPGLVPAFSASGQDVWVSAAEHEGPGIVISAVGARCGRCFFAPTGGWTAIANTHVMKPLSPDVNVKFWWYLVNDQNWWVRSGTAQPFVVVKKSLERNCLIPPLAEQQRIVGAIEEHFTRIDAAEAVLRSLQFEVSRLLVTSRMSVFREPGKTVTLDSRATTQLGKMLSKKSKTGIGSAPYLRNKNVRWGKVDVSDVAEMDFSEGERSKFKLERNDVLVCEGGAGVGRAAIWRSELEPCYFQKALHRVRPGPDLLPEFLVQYFHHLVESNNLQHHLSGVAIGHLPQEDLRKLPLPDLDVNQQKSVVETLSLNESLVQSIMTSTTNALLRSTVLRRSLLARAFCGRLVSQDTADEPADVQLKRIQVDRLKERSTPGKRGVGVTS